MNHPLQKGTSVSTTDLSALGAELRGPLLLPGTDGYEEETLGFNRILPQTRPAAVVVADGTADIIAAVRSASRSGLAVAVQATGHGVSVPADGALLINTRNLTGVRVDPRARTARIEPGAQWSRVIQEAAPFGLAPLNGASPGVGVVSYHLGGGLGPLGRSYGYAADHVRNFDLVTADGELLHVSPDDHPDLFWAQRGGKGNFGVITSIEIGLFPVSRLYGGGLFLPGEHIERILPAWRDWTQAVPDAMQSSIAVMRFPDIDVLPEPVRGRFLAHVRIAFNGSNEEGAELVRPLRELVEPVLDTVADMPYTDVADINMDPTVPAVYFERSTRIRELDDAAIATLIPLIKEGADAVRPGIELRHLGGALGRQPEHPNAVPHRDTAYTLFAGAPVWPEHVQDVREFQERLMEEMEPWRIGGPFLSFISALESSPEHLRSAYDPQTYERLVAAKDAYDPQNVFRVNHNIPPTGWRAR
ncbi:FAD-binding oxidoreductase [Streptomyces sp. KD18]|nr:FAD-binding oxidoreductase [Streptomyces sp. KD18]GGS83640.1 oxidoreductase [Streptomyces toxytricini]